MSDANLSEWYRQTQTEHNLDLGATQRFPLKGDGLVAQRIVADGPFNGPDIGAELALARYRDWQHEHGRMEKQMPQSELDTKLEAYLQTLLNRQAQAQETQAVTERRTLAPDQPKEEQRRERSLSI